MVSISDVVISQRSATVSRPTRPTKPSLPVVLPAIERSAAEVTLFHFIDAGSSGYDPAQMAEQSVQLQQSFRRQLLREPLRLLSALPRLSVMERRLYWLVLSALKQYQYTQSVTSYSASLLEQRLRFTFHKSALRPINAAGRRSKEVSSVAIRQMLAELAGKTLRWQNQRGDTVNVNMFDTEYQSGKGLIALELNPKLTDAFLKLGNDFAPVNLERAMQLDSNYAQVLYTYLCRHRWRGKWRIGVPELRNLLGVTRTVYDRYSVLANRIIKTSLRDINLLGDMRVTLSFAPSSGPTRSTSSDGLVFTISTLPSPGSSDGSNQSPDRLVNSLEQIATMGADEKIYFAQNMLRDYYPGLAGKRELILSNTVVLDAFIRADAYVEAGMVAPAKHDAYVAKAIAGCLS